MSSVRYERLHRLIALLQSRKSVSRGELEAAGQYTFTKKRKGYEQNRTLQKDLDFLRDEGAEIVYDRAMKKYILRREGSLLVNIKISGGEVKALAAGLRMAGHFLPHLEEDAGELWDKIAAYIPQDLAQEGDSLARSTVISIPAAKVKPEVFSLLTKAKHKRKAVNILYISPGNEPREWTVSPYDFYFRGNSLYMVSFNHKHSALTTHRMSRITRASYADDEYVPPETGGFTDDYALTAWHVSPGKDKHLVRILLRGRLAETVREVEFHPTQKLDKAGDGGVILTAEVPYLDEAARWVLSCAGNAVVIEPDELRGMVRDYAAMILEGSKNGQAPES